MPPRKRKMCLGAEARESDFVSKATQLRFHYDDATGSVQCTAVVPGECKYLLGLAKTCGASSLRSWC
ncbi:hypothetical protein DIPPA_27557 [Diplonema papillatum]|nr:hypothetical protein DIPPA_27557 [Diplonema papillatum]